MSHRTVSGREMNRQRPYAVPATSKSKAVSKSKGEMSEFGEVPTLTSTAVSSTPLAERRALCAEALQKSVKKFAESGLSYDDGGKVTRRAPMTSIAPSSLPDLNVRISVGDDMPLVQGTSINALENTLVGGESVSQPASLGLLGQNSPLEERESSGSPYVRDLFDVSRMSLAGGGPLHEAPRLANDVLQKTKTELERSKNMNREIREAVVVGLQCLYEIVLRLSDSRTRHIAEKERCRANFERSRTSYERGAAKLQKEQVERLEALQVDVQAQLGELRILSEKSYKEAEAARHLVYEVQDKLKGSIGAISGSMEGSELISKLTEEVRTFKEECAQPIPRGPFAGQRTYADAARPVHTIIVSSKNPADTADDVLNAITSSMDARREGLQIERCKKARDGKVVLSCAEEPDIKMLAGRFRERDLNVMEAQNKNPLVELRNVLTFNSDSDICESIQRQNKHITAGLDMMQEKIQVRFRRRARNQLECHVVVEVSPRLWKRLVNAGRLFIGMQRPLVFDRSPLIQCSKCLGYGHSGKVCEAAEIVCAHCGGAHERARCDKLNTPPQCCNCKREGKTLLDHHAFSDVCVERRKWDGIARSRVAYC